LQQVAVNCEQQSHVWSIDRRNNCLWR